MFQHFPHRRRAAAVDAIVTMMKRPNAIARYTQNFAAKNAKTQTYKNINTVRA